MKTLKVQFDMKNQAGYTLLFAVLTATLVLGVAVFILSISRGQYLLASTARESTYAIYAADSGIECAAKVARVGIVTDGSMNTFNCAGTPVTLSTTEYTANGVNFPAFQGGTAVYQGISRVKLSGSECAVITFNIGTAATSHNDPMTQIESRGYNYCSASGNPAVLGPDTTNPKVVERAIRLTYVGI